MPPVASGGGGERRRGEGGDQTPTLWTKPILTYPIFVWHVFTTNTLPWKTSFIFVPIKIK